MGFFKDLGLMYVLHISHAAVQVVWDTTYEVGCGKAWCDRVTGDDGKSRSNVWIVTCNYGPV